MFKMELMISNSHVNNQNKMKDLAIINALQDIEGIHINSLKDFTNHLNDNNLGVFLLYRQIDIIKRPQFGEKVILATHPYETGLVSGYRHIYINDQLGNPYVKSNAFGAYVNLDTYKPTRLPKEIIKTLNDGVRDISFENLPRKIYYELENIEKVSKIKVKKIHIDRYNHVNNAYYVEFVLEFIDDSNKFNRIRTEYINSFKINDEVIIYKTVQKNSNYIFLLKDQNDRLNAIIEFSQIKN